jgi:hypothetical protein
MTKGAVSGKTTLYCWLLKIFFILRTHERGNFLIVWSSVECTYFYRIQIEVLLGGASKESILLAHIKIIMYTGIMG